MAYRPRPHYPTGPSPQNITNSWKIDNQQLGDGIQRMQLHSAGKLLVLGCPLGSIGSHAQTLNTRVFLHLHICHRR